MKLLVFLLLVSVTQQLDQLEIEMYDEFLHDDRTSFLSSKTAIPRKGGHLLVKGCANPKVCYHQCSNDPTIPCREICNKPLAYFLDNIPLYNVTRLPVNDTLGFESYMDSYKEVDQQHGPKILCEGRLDGFHYPTGHVPRFSTDGDCIKHNFSCFKSSKWQQSGVTKTACTLEAYENHFFDETTPSYTECSIYKDYFEAAKIHANPRWSIKRDVWYLSVTDKCYPDSLITTQTKTNPNPYYFYFGPLRVTAFDGQGNIDPDINSIKHRPGDMYLIRNNYSLNIHMDHPSQYGAFTKKFCVLVITGHSSDVPLKPFLHNHTIDVSLYWNESMPILKVFCRVSQSAESDGTYFYIASAELRMQCPRSLHTQPECKPPVWAKTIPSKYIPQTALRIFNCSITIEICYPRILRRVLKKNLYCTNSSLEPESTSLRRTSTTIIGPATKPTVGPATTTTVGPATTTTVGPATKPTVGPATMTTVGPATSTSIEILMEQAKTEAAETQAIDEHEQHSIINYAPYVVVAFLLTFCFLALATWWYYRRKRGDYIATDPTIVKPGESGDRIDALSDNTVAKVNDTALESISALATGKSATVVVPIARIAPCSVSIVDDPTVAQDSGQSLDTASSSPLIGQQIPSTSPKSIRVSTEASTVNPDASMSGDGLLLDVDRGNIVAKGEEPALEVPAADTSAPVVDPITIIPPGSGLIGDDPAIAQHSGPSPEIASSSGLIRSETPHTSPASFGEDSANWDESQSSKSNDTSGR